MRDKSWAGSDAEASHRDRYPVAERIYIDEVHPLELADVIIDNTESDRTRLLRV